MLYTLIDGSLIQKRDAIDKVPVCIFDTGADSDTFRSLLRDFLRDPDQPDIAHGRTSLARRPNASDIVVNGAFHLPLPYAAAIALE